MTVALFDGDGFLHRVAAAVEKTKYGVQDSKGDFSTFENWAAARRFEEETKGILWSRLEVGSLEQCVKILDTIVHETVERVGCTKFQFVLGDRASNFRDVVAWSRRYKGNRYRRPQHLEDLRRWALDNLPCVETVMEEADDYISYTARSQGWLVVSNDKDLKQIPGAHFNWVNAEHFKVNEEEAKMNLWIQALMGDPGDNIGGCWKLGPARAKHLVEDWFAQGLDDTDIWMKVVELYARSQTLSGCPYEAEDPEDIAEETYTLVKLLEDPLDKYNILESRLAWITKRNQKRENQDGNISKESPNQDESTSESVRPAEAPAGVGQGDIQDHAQNATDSEQPTPSPNPIGTEPEEFDDDIPWGP